MKLETGTTGIIPLNGHQLKLITPDLYLMDKAELSSVLLTAMHIHLLF